MRRPNLTVLTDTVADRVVFDGTRAVAVRGRRSGEPVDVEARRQIILSGGAVSSPLILQRSGIGDPELLGQHAIDVVVASPEVGENLQDHLMVALVYGWSEPVTLVDAEKPVEVVRYLTRRKGLLTSNIGEAAAFFRSSPACAAPDLELIFGPVPYIDHGLGPPVTQHAVTSGPVLLQPTSRGTVRITSADADAPPTIDPQYLTGDHDLERLITGVRETLRLFGTSAMSPFLTDAIEAPRSDTDDDIAAFLAEQAETIYHPVGTCRMGADDASVVDPELRVRGVDGLRVADTSIMPSLNRGHTHAPAVMIGERAADLVHGAP
jgi:choline dehydrogenase